MRISPLLALASAALLFSTGCAGPEKKLGRGLLNATEFARLGELRRSMEQSALWSETDTTYTTGIIKGFNRSITRTAVGLYEIVTFPFPSYDPMFTSTNRIYPDYSVAGRSYPWGGQVLPEYPGYPDSYKPKLISAPTFDTDTSLGFSGGDVAPMIPGSRFHIFDN